jgi:hypothetical protein
LKNGFFQIFCHWICIRADAEHVARAAAAAELALKQHQHALSSLQSQHSQALQVLQQQHDESSQRERREADERIRAKEVQIQEHERQLYDLSQESKRKDEANEQEKHTLAREMQVLFLFVGNFY